MSLVSLTRKSFCYLAAGATMGYISRPKILGETLLRNDGDILSSHASPTIPLSPVTIQTPTDESEAPSLFHKIDMANLQPRRWEHIILHHSASNQGSAAIFDLYHRTIRKMVNGLAYHFVIGNGTNSGDGEVEISRRWQSQIQGGHVKDPFYNSNSIGICLVGNFETYPPSSAQIKATTELVDYLKNTLLLGKPNVLLHRDIQKTLCPGRFFPEDILRSAWG